ncbi:MAG: putative toxin-antitoxin system toxin component, PIN family [Bacteroidota bacterium]
MRIVIDTNVFIIALIGKSSPKLIEWLSDKRFTILFSKESYSELIEVIRRPKFEKLFTEQRVFTLLDLLDSIKIMVLTKSKTEICRDKKDNFLLNLAKDGEADYLITEDFDLLALGTHFETKIVNYNQFIKEVIL